jgi:excisionase family DNA binding protein
MSHNSASPPTPANKKPLALDGCGRPVNRLTKSDDLPELLTVAEAAQWLGVHAGMIRSLIAGGTLPEVRFGRLVRTTKAALAGLIAGAAPASRQRRDR